MSLVGLLEWLAANTWQRVRDGHELGVRLGETGLTDYLLLELKRVNSPRLHVFKTSQNLEAKQGTDWEWWIGSNQTGWIRYAVQAKKLYLDKHTYARLRHSVGGVEQVDVLEQYANANDAVPLYCFYNYSDWVDLATCWQCSLLQENDQLGCTITPSFIVRDALAPGARGRRNFEAIHGHSQTIPWRCLVKCPRIHRVYDSGPAVAYESGMSLFGQPVHVFQSLPPEFANASETGELAEFPQAYYSGDIDALPKRVMVLDFSEEEEAPNNRNTGAQQVAAQQATDEVGRLIARPK